MPDPIVTTEKKALKGFDGARMWPVTANTLEAYTAGAAILMPSAQQLTKQTTYQEITIYADDDVYHSGREFLYEDLTFRLAELPLEIEALLQGSTYDDAKKEYTFKTTDEAPEFAYGYGAPHLTGNQYRMWQHYCCRLMSIKVEHKPRPADTDIQPYELTLRSTRRKADRAPFKVMESTDGTMAKLSVIDQIPAA